MLECKQHAISLLLAAFNRDENPISSSRTLLEELGKVTIIFLKAELREFRNTDGDAKDSD
jgi:hypothetical protein